MKLTEDLILRAYSNGYFPMEDHRSGEILWFRPDPRAIIPLNGFHVSRSLQKTIEKGVFRVSFDEAFSAVMEGCADRPETWIGEDFFTVYGGLHTRGHAHSVEVWAGKDLVGGLYGLAMGGAFFAESKFHRKTDASKVALHALVEHLKAKGFLLLEVQFLTDHLKRLGATEVSADEYEAMLVKALCIPAKF